MADSDENWSKKFKELNDKIWSLNNQESNVFSRDVLEDWFRSFDELVIGTTTFLKEKINYYNNICCHIKIGDFVNQTIHSQEELILIKEEFVSIDDLFTIELSFTLSDSEVWPDLSPVERTVEIQFMEEHFEYSFEDYKWTKDYGEHLKPVEIVELRDTILGFIFNDISTQVT